jgi:hypothetical protein
MAAKVSYALVIRHNDDNIGLYFVLRQTFRINGEAEYEYDKQLAGPHDYWIWISILS